MGKYFLIFRKRDYINRGFTLIELLIYVGVFAVIAVAFSGILVTFVRVNVDQVAQSEITSQLNFITQTLRRMIGEAGVVVVRGASDGIDVGVDWDEVDGALGQPAKYLILKMSAENNLADDSKSPVVVYEDNNNVVIREGRGAGVQLATLNSDKVKVETLSFIKLANYPGRDLVQINITLSFISDGQQEPLSRRLVVGTAKAVAAIFDTSLIPGINNNQQDVGALDKQWHNGYFSNDLSVGGSANVGALNIGGDSPINGVYHGIVSIDLPSIISANGNDIREYGPFEGPPIFVAAHKIILTPPVELENGLIFVGAEPVIGTKKIKINIRNVTSNNITGAATLDWSYLIIR